MPAFAITSEHVDGGVLIALTGELDDDAASFVTVEVRRHVHRYDRGQVTFDCSRITTVSPRGAAGLADAVRPLSGPGRPVLLSPPTLLLASLGDLGRGDLFQVETPQAA